MCEGDGLIRIDMHFMSDVYVTCEGCEGKRYNREVLDVTFKGRNIADVLEMNLDEAADFFRATPGLGDKLLLVPGHCDPTVNLYDWYVCVRGGIVEALWPISARGAIT